MKSGDSAVPLETRTAQEAVPPDPSESEGLASVKPPDPGEVAALAHQYWQERGCPTGSPDEDWFRAERALNELSQKVSV